MTNINFQGLGNDGDILDETKSPIRIVSRNPSVYNVNLTQDTNTTFSTRDEVNCLNIPESDCSVAFDTVFDTGVYNNVFDLDGDTAAIEINANGITLDGNGSTITGNVTFIGIHDRGSDRNNIVIKNITLINYARGLLIKDSTNYQVYNSTFFNSGTYGIHVQSSDGIIIKNVNVSVAGTNNIRFEKTTSLVTNVTVDNLVSETNGSSGGLFYAIHTKDIKVRNSSFYGVDEDISFYNTSNGLFSNNTVKDFDLLRLDDGTTTRGVYDFVIEDSLFNNNSGQYAIQVNYLSDNITIRRNTFNLSDMAIQLRDYVWNVTIENNTFTNMYTHVDAYDLAIHLFNTRNTASQRSYNTIIRNNSLINFGCVGILVRGGFNTEVSNNYFETNLTYLLNRSIDQPFNCRNEPIIGIFFEEIYKGFIPGGTQNFDNYTLASTHYSNNATVTGNTFSGVNVLLKTQGTTNLTEDITNAWTRSWRDPYFTDIDKIWVDNSFNNVSGIKLSGVYRDELELGVGNQWSFNTTHYDDYSKFVNIKTGLISDINLDLELYELTDALVYFSNGSVPGSCTTVSECDGNVNVTITPGNHTFVLDDYSVTEGTSRANDPVWFTQSTTQTRHIANNLTETITVLVTITADPGWGANCELLSELEYKTDSGVTTTWTGDNARTVCQSLTTTGYTLDIEPATSSNELNFTLGATSLSTRILKLIMGFLALTVLIFAAAGILMYAKDNFSGLKSKEFINYAISLLLITVLMIVLINYIATIL